MKILNILTDFIKESYNAETFPFEYYVYQCIYQFQVNYFTPMKCDFALLQHFLVPTHCTDKKIEKFCHLDSRPPSKKLLYIYAMLWTQYLSSLNEVFVTDVYFSDEPPSDDNIMV